MKTSDSLTSCSQVNVRATETFAYLLEGRERCKGAQGPRAGSGAGASHGRWGSRGFRRPGGLVGGGPGAAASEASAGPLPSPGRAPPRSLPLVPGRPPQWRRRSRAWGPGGAVAQRRRRQERPRRRWRLRRGSPPAAPRSSRRSLEPPARFSGAPPGSAWLRRSRSPMRLGRRWALAAAATTAPSGAGGFAAAPGAAPVPSGGGCRLRDDPLGHAEAAAAAARGECGAARRGPGFAGLQPQGRALAVAFGPGGRGVLPLRPPPPPRGSGPSTLLLRVPREARGGRLGPAPPGSPRPASVPARPGVCVERDCWRGLWHLSGWLRTRAERSLLPRARHVHPGGRQRTPVCKQPRLFRAG